MARKSKIRVSKTRIRSYFRRIATYEAEEIDRFREHVYDGRMARRKSLETFAASLPEEAQEFLTDDFSQLDTICELADQLSVVALYRIVELNIDRMLAHEFGTQTADKVMKGGIDKVRKFLKDERHLDLKNFPHHRAIDELRLLNNAIKHAGKVTPKLANYPRWKQGKKLTGLDAAYGRLRPKVPPYLYRFAERMKLRYK